MNDLFCRLLANSDPLTSNLRYKYKKPLRSLSSEARELLKASNIPEIRAEIEDECDIFYDIGLEDIEIDNIEN